MSFFFQLTPTSVHVEQTACSCKGCCCCGAAAAAATGGATGGAALQLLHHRGQFAYIVSLVRLASSRVTLPVRRASPTR